MTTSRHSSSAISRLIKSTLRPASLALGVLLIAGAQGARADAIVQEFFVPMPEVQIRQGFLKLGPSVGATLDSVISIVTPVPGTKIVYDHWEDGYEIDLNNPAQITTEIWGDGNDADGKPPGYAQDPLGFAAGNVIALRNLVPLPRTGTILYDGRDRVGATQAIVMSRSAWATSPGPVLADATEVPSTVDYGTAFTMPVGQDVTFPSPTTSSMFEYVAAFILAAEDGTNIQVDKNGNGSVLDAGDVAVTRNRGESYLVDGGILKGTKITSTKNVQVQLFTGDIGANYENRWFTITPDDVWSSEYYSPVGTASDGDDTYIFLHNPSTAPITIDYVTRVGSGNFVIPAKDTYRYLMPQNSGASFTSSGYEPFYAVGTVGAEPTANNVHDWGFSLVPTANLTSELVVGWGPGSSDGTQNGSPAWVTAVAPTTIYVDYNGDRAGPLTDPKGGKYDVALNVAALEVNRIYEADKDQTGLRMYTLDGTLITGAWGQDPAVAGPAMPYLDVGTVIPNFPIPVLSKSSEVVVDDTAAPPTGAMAGLSVGDTIEYTLTLENKGLVALSAVSILDTPPSASMAYVTNSTTRDGLAVADDAPSATAFPLDEGGLTVPILLRKGVTVIKYRMLIMQAGSITNLATTNVPGVGVSHTLVVPGTAAHACGIDYTTAGGASTDYNPAAGIYVTLTDLDANLNGAAPDTLVVVVQNSTNGDLEQIGLTETGNATGVFRNTAALPSSATAGGLQYDGTLRAVSGDALSVAYTDPLYGDSCNGAAAILTSANTKPLYLTPDGADNDTTGWLDRIDPVNVLPQDTTSSSTSILAAGAAATISPVATTNAGSGDGTDATSLTFSHTPGSGSNRLLLVAVATGSADGDATQGGVTGVTFNGQTMSLVGSRTTGTGDNTNSYIYMLKDADLGTTGAANVVVTTATSSTIVASATTFTGVDQTTPLGTYASATGTGTNLSLASPYASAVGEVVYSIGSIEQGDTDRTITTSTANGQTQLWNIGNNQFVDAATSTIPGAATVSPTYTASSSRVWTLGAVSIKPAAGSGGGSSTFTQTPGFCSAFDMPAGGALSVRNYVSVPSGSLPANPAITATLQHGVTSFATLSSPTATLISGGADTVTHEATTSSSSASTTSLTFSHTPGTGSNRLLLVAVAVGATTTNGDPPFSAPTVTFGGTAMTLVGSRPSGNGGGAGTGDDTISYLYRLVNPGSGAANVVVNLGATAGSIAAGASTFTGVDQTTPLGTLAAASGTSGTATVNVTSATGQLVFGTVSRDGNPTLTVGDGQTERWNITGAGNGAVSGAASTEPGATSVTHSYGAGNTTEDWAILAVPIRPALSTAIYQLDWSTTLGSAVTVPSGQATSLTVENGTSAPFSILYDSATYPSVVNLPATTVISVNSIGVYDALYPGGNLIPTPANGQIVYVRTVVSDPFGAYDITSLPLAIDGPGTGDDVSVTLMEPNVVASTPCAKTYEYVWHTGAATGPYNIAVTAKEGYENAVTDQKSTTVTISQLDLGTPSTTEFTTGLNGPHTLEYAANEDVCVRVTDIDQNKNSGAAETLTVVIAGSGGDAETVTLTETGANTGVFAACIPASSTVPGSNNNGTLYAQTGSVPVVNYVDPDDPTDTGSDTAIIPTGSASVAVAKTLVSPADGQILVDATAQFLLRVTNNGNSTLATVQVVDSFPPGSLQYLSATPAPDSTTATTLTWNNVGPLTVGQSVDILVDFKGLASASPAVNTVNVTTGGGPTATDTENVIITNPKLTVTKTRLTPASGPVNLGDTQSYRLVVQNTGDTAIATLPLEDTYSAACFSFVSATVPPDSAAAGNLLWSDITSAGSLAPSASVTIDVTLKAKGGCNPGDNVAAVNYAVDVNGDPVPPTSATADVTTLAASIGGVLYDDDSTPGFGGTNTPLSGVTMTLYTDPNGDGDPSDGVVVGITTTGANGAYEFLNLGLGGYVVVETDPAGYTSIDDTGSDDPHAGSIGDPEDTDNRIRVAVTTLTAYTGNDFLDDLIDPANYGTITGQVRNDVDADGDLADAEAGIGGVTIQLYTDPNGDGNPADGVLVQTTTTAASGSVGSYTFSYVPPGNYVVVETDPATYVSTGDKVNPNDNRIGVVAPAGGTSSGNDFLDTTNTASLGTIGNLVWKDLNNDGIYDADGADDIALTADDETGIGGVIVELYLASQTPGVNSPYLVTTTSGSGLYSFANVPAGSYRVYLPLANFAVGGALAGAPLSVSPTDTADNQQDNDDNGIQGGVGQPVTSPTIALTAAETENTVDFGFVPNTSLGGIGDTVWLDTDRDGVYDNGEPGLANVSVELAPAYGVTDGSIDLNGGGVGNDDDGWLRGIEVIDGALDLDGDGVITGADTGTFFGMPVVNGLLDLNGGGVDTTDDGYTGGDTLAYEVTDMQGHYLFTSVPAGNYVVLVNEGSLPGAPGSLTETAGTTNASGLISHAAGAIDLDVDFGYVPTTKAVIGNFVWSDADGDGVQDPGEPGIGGVTLGLLKDADNNGTFETTVTTTTTAADGSYYFFGVDPGKYKVEVTSVLSGYTLTTGPQSSTDPTAAITVGAGTIYDKADFGYTNPNLYSISDRTWYDANRNGIAEVSETGIAGVTMDLVLDQNGDGITDYEVIAGRIDLNGDGKADTGDDGTLDGKPVKDGFLDMDGDGFITAADDGTYNGYPVIDGVLDLNASGGVPANTGRIGDLVWLDRNGDGALNAGEGPLPGVTVYLCASSPCASGNATGTTVTDANGGYLFDGLAAGNYYVNLSGLPANLTATTNPTGQIALAQGQAYTTADFGYKPTGATAVIGDRIWSDADGDGIQDAGEAGIGGVPVELRDGACTPGSSCPTATTKADGSYLFTNVAAGPYTVVVTTPPAGYTQTGDPDGTLNSQTSVTVAAGDVKLTADFGYRHTTNAGGSIGETLFADLNGNGVQDAGEPGIAGVTLNLYASDGTTLIATTSSTASGAYSFAGLPVSAGGVGYVVEVSDTGNVLGNGIQTADPDEPGIVCSVCNYRGSATLYTTGNGTGPTDNTVDFGFYTEDSGTISPEPVIASAISDANGDFTFDGLPNGNYAIRISDNDGRLANLQGTTPNAQAGSRGVTVSGASVEGENFGYAGLGPIGDTIFSDADNNGVQDPGESGIAGVQASLYLDDGDGVFEPGTGDTLLGTRITDASGTYLFNDLPAGTFWVSVNDVQSNLTGYTATTTDADPTATPTSTEYKVTLSSTNPSFMGADYGYRNTVLADVSGTVWNDPNRNSVLENGEPRFAGVTVALVDSNGKVLATTTTDGLGHYSFPDVPAGNYKVAVTDDADVLNGFSLTSGLDQIPVTVGATDLTGVNFGYARKTGTGSIGDSVWLDANNDGVFQPNETGVSGVTVALKDGSGNTIASAVTDSDGRYLFSGLLAGNYTVGVIGGVPANLIPSAGTTDPTGVIALSDGEAYLDADFGYKPDATHAVIGDTVWYDVDGDGVRDSGEVGIGGVVVKVVNALTQAVVAVVTTSPDGSWLAVIPEDGVDTEYVVVVDKTTLPGGLITTPTNMNGGDTYIATVKGGEARLNLDFGYKGGVAGTIGDQVFLDADGDNSPDAGEGLSGVTLTLSSIGIIFGKVDVNGDGVIDANDDGSYGGYAVTDGVLAAAANGNTINGMKVIVGQLDVNHDGSIAANDDQPATVVATTITDANGIYQFGGLLAGDYRVKVTAGLPADLTQSVGMTIPTSIITLASGGSHLTADFGYVPGSGTAVIGDRIWSDANGDGVQDSGEVGIGGVTVTLQPPAGVNLGNGPGVAITTTTNPDGTYLFTNIPASGSIQYIVSVTPPSGYDSTPTNHGVFYTPTPTSQQIVLTADWGFKDDGTASASGSIGDTVYGDTNGNGVQDGGETGINGVTLNLVSIGVINGYVDLNGDSVITAADDGSFGGYAVTDGVLAAAANGNTINGMTVIGGRLDVNGDAAISSPDNLNAQVLATTITATVGANSGVYSFTGLPVGDYRVEVTDTASVLANESPTQVSGGAIAVACSGTCTNSQNADFGYTAATTGSGKIGETLYFDSDGSGAQNGGEIGIGGVTLDLVSIGIIDGYVDLNGDGQITAADAGTYGGYAVANGVLSGVADGTLVNGIKVFSGRLDTSGNGSVGVEDDKAPQVIGTKTTSDGTTDVDGNGSIDLVGTYWFTGVEAGGYRVVVTDTNSVLGGLTPTQTAGAKDITCSGATCTTVSDADFGYQSTTGGTGTLGGTLWRDTDATGGGTTGVLNTGEPRLAGITVELWLDVDSSCTPDTQCTPVPGIDNLVRTTTTNSNGDYVFLGIPPGKYIVKVTDTNGVLAGMIGVTGANPTADNNGHVPPYATTLTLGEVDTSVDFGYKASGTPASLSGTVFEDAGTSLGVYNAPTTGGDDAYVPGATVYLYRLVNGQEYLIGTTATAADGSYSFADLPAGGTYVVKVDTTGTLAEGMQQTFDPSESGTCLTCDSQYTVTLNSSVTGIDFGYWNGGIVTTPVTLAYFKATPDQPPGTVRFEWWTATETGNLGFELFVEMGKGKDKERVRISAEPILGKVSSTEPMPYAYTVDSVAGDVFWITDVDIDSKRTWHGPYRLGKAFGHIPKVKAIDWKPVKKEKADKKAGRAKKSRGNAAAAVEVAAVQGGTADAVDLVVMRDPLDETYARVTYSTSARVYRVTYAALAAAGMDLKGVPLDRLAVYNRGQQVPIQVVGGGAGKNKNLFVSGSYLEFVGEGADSLYTDANPYRLVVGKGKGARVAVDKRTLPARFVPAPYYMERVTREREWDYAIESPNGDPWFDEYLVAWGGPSGALSRSIGIDQIVPGAAQAQLEVGLWGVTSLSSAPDHHVVVGFNGQSDVGDIQFDGRADGTVKIALPGNLLTEGTNTVTLKLPFDLDYGLDEYGEAGYDMIALDRYSVTYPRRFVARNGRLGFTAAGAAFTVTGLPSNQVVVYRTDSGGVSQVTGVKVSGSGSNYSASFPGTATAATYHVASASALGTPGIAPVTAPVDCAKGGEAKFLVIAHEDFINADLQRLVDARAAEGYSTAVVPAGGLYAQYNHGIFDPSAIHACVKDAVARRGTEAVLLVGADTYDYMDYFETGAESFLPSIYAQTGSIVHWAPADGLVGDVDGDGLPDVAVGRFPVRTGADLTNMVNRTLAYGKIAYGKTAVFAADKYDTAQKRDFRADSQAIVAELPIGWTVQTAYLDDSGVTNARTQLIGAINTGVALTAFVGHSGPTAWTFDGLFTSVDAAALTNAGKPTVVTQWGCWNTFYVSPYSNSLGHSFLLSGDRGAAAVLGASTLTEADHETEFGKRLFGIGGLADGGTPVGEAILRAKRDIALDYPDWSEAETDWRDVIFGWQLLGDPLLRINP